jgi:hypothetical protein
MRDSGVCEGVRRVASTRRVGGAGRVAGAGRAGGVRRVAGAWAHLLASLSAGALGATAAVEFRQIQ